MTFIQIAGSGATSLVASATLNPNTPCGGNSWDNIGAASAGLGTWSSTSFTVAVSGHYVATWYHQPNSTNTGWFVAYARKNSGQVGPYYSYNCTDGSQTTYSGYAEFDAVNGDVIDLFCPGFGGSNGTSSAGTFSIRFVPTPSHPH